MSSASALVDMSTDNCLDVLCHASATHNPHAPLLADDAILSAARRAGMLVMLDAQIGRERYQSVTGSLYSLHRFVVELHKLILDHSTV